MSAGCPLNRETHSASNGVASKDVLHVWSMSTTDTTVLHRCVDSGKINIRETSGQEETTLFAERFLQRAAQIF